MSLELRGGIPTIYNITIDTTGREIHEVGQTQFIQIYNTNDELLHIFFREDDFAADDNLLILPIDVGFWEGPARFASRATGGDASNLNKLFLKAAANTTTVTIVTYHSRG